MTTEIDPHKHADQKMMVKYQGGGSDTVYALGIIGDGCITSSASPQARRK